MKSFILTLCVASLLGGFSAMLAGNTYGKYIKFLASLACTLMLLSPFASLKNLKYEVPLKEAEEIINENRDAAASEVEDEALRMAESYISESIYSHFGIKVHSVSILFDGKAAKAVITATVPEETVKTVEEYVKECFDMEAEVNGA